MTDIVRTAWVVITGAPCSGKTSLINGLSGLGHPVVEDCARATYVAYSARATEQNFIQSKILNLLEKKMFEQDSRTMTFFDYAMPDNLVFQRLNNHELEKALENIFKYRYEKVFICEPLEFLPDGIRDKDGERQSELSEAIYDVYREFGYELHWVPISSIQSRIEFILSIMEKKDDITF